MSQLRHPENFVSSVAYVEPIIGLQQRDWNNAAERLTRIHSLLRTAREQFGEGRYESAISSYKTARSLIYQLRNPKHSIDVYVANDAFVHPVSEQIEAQIAEAGLKLVENARTDVMRLPAPVRVFDDGDLDETTRFDSVGFTADASLSDLDERLTTGVELLAERHSEQAIELFRDTLEAVGEPQTTEERRVAAATALNLSSALLAVNEPAQAEEMARLARTHFDATDDAVGQSQATHNLAVALARDGNHQAANEAFTDATRLLGLGAPDDGGPDRDLDRDTSVEPRRMTIDRTDESMRLLSSSGARLDRDPRVLAARPDLVGGARTADDLVSVVRPETERTALEFIEYNDAETVAVRWAGSETGWAGLPLADAATATETTWTLGVEAGGEVVSLEWADGRRPEPSTLIAEVYEPRIAATAISELAVKLVHTAQTGAYLPHVYSFVIPQALGDCYHELGDYRRAEEYYRQAAGYSYLNAAIEAPALWVKLAENTLAWGDSLYKGEEVEACQPVYAKLVTREGTVPTDSMLFDTDSLSAPADEARSVIERFGAGAVTGTDPDELDIDVNPTIAYPLLIAWQRWQYLVAGLDFYGTSFTPVFTFEYLEGVATAFAERAIQAEREYVNFQVQAEAESATRRNLENAAALAAAEAASQRELWHAAVDERSAMDASVDLMELRAENAAEDRNAYRTAGRWQYTAQSIAAAHSAGADWHESEIRELAADMEAGSWEGKSGKLAAAATLLGGQKSYEYQLGRLDNTVEEMNATVPIAEAQARAAANRQQAAFLVMQASQLRHSLTEEALTAFDEEVFTPELWTNMARVMRNISRSYQYSAIRLAKLAERAYNFETDSDVGVIKNGYSPSDTDGLLGSDYLLRDIQSLRYYYVVFRHDKETNVKDVVSLANDYPLAFADFHRTGEVTFETALYDFDRRHPGLFGQRVHAVEVEVVGLLPPEGVTGTLRGGIVSRYRTEDGDERTRVHGVDTLALSEYDRRGDALVYRTDPRLHGLFEGHGVATTWELDLPRRSNNLDYRLITDVRLVVYYSARYDENLAHAVATRDPLPGELVHARDFRLRYDFPEAWYDLLDSGELSMEVTPEFLPRNETGFAVERLAVQLLAAADADPTGVDVTLAAPGRDPMTLTTDANGRVDVSEGTAGEPLLGGALLGEWTLALDPSDASGLTAEDGAIDPDALEQVTLIVEYGFEWPEEA